MRVAVMGAGSLGGFYGGLLARAGHDVTFVARGEHLKAIQRDGLTIWSKLVGDFTLPVKVTDDPATIRPVDVVLFAVKSYDLDEAATAMKPLVGADTTVLSVQNGIDNEERLGRILGEEKVIGGAVYVSSQVAAPGVIQHLGGPGQVLIGELPGGASPRVQRLADHIRDAGVEVIVHDNIQKALWEKFVTICAFSGVTALTRLPLGPVTSCPETRAFFREVMVEVAAVGRARGVAVQPSYPDDTLEMLSQPRMAGLYGSMAHDLMAGRRLEIDTLNGTVVRLGLEVGVSAPCNFAIHAALKPYADGAPVASA